VKLRSSDRIDLAVALAMAVGVLADLEREALVNYEQVDYMSVEELAGEWDEHNRVRELVNNLTG
jgi:hypothetical protein